MLNQNHIDRLHEIWEELMDIHKELHVMRDEYKPCSEGWNEIGMVTSSMSTTEDIVNHVAHVLTNY